MKLTTLVLAMTLLAISCAPQPTEDAKFESLAKNYIEQLLKTKPEWATGLGDHRYDGELGDYTKAGVDADRALNARYLDSLRGIAPAQLSQVNRIDYEILKNSLEGWIFSIDTLREYEWNPLYYNPGGAIYGLIARDFAPLKDRLESVRQRLEKLPSVLAAARQNLQHPPMIFTETAILQNPGTISMVRDELQSFIDQVPEMKEKLVPAQDAAVAALEAYGTWLAQHLKPRSDGDFRIGDMKFRRKLYYTLESDLSKEEILRRAQDDLKKTQETMYETALPLYKKYFPGMADEATTGNRKVVIRKVLDKLAEDRPTNETIVGLARQDLDECTAFVGSQNLVTVPAEPVKVIVMPEFQRGVAVAYCDPAGPLEKGGETFYSIAPTPKDWTAARAVSFFREYNNYMLKNLTIHEAMPGHYLQLAHANTFAAPTLVRAIFSSGTFIEGWATYAEQLMAEQGFGGPEVHMQQLKMRLRLIINAIIDQKIHTEGMTEKDAVALMMDEGFQEEGEASGKWRRACLSSTQLSTYYVGNTEINDIRNGYRAVHGEKADLKAMHDAMLAYGSPAPKYVNMMLGLK